MKLRKSTDVQWRVSKGGDEQLAEGNEDCEARGENAEVPEEFKRHTDFVEKLAGLHTDDDDLRREDYTNALRQLVKECCYSQDRNRTRSGKRSLKLTNPFQVAKSSRTTSSTRAKLLR